jgi:hypothetical protein
MLAAAIYFNWQSRHDWAIVKWSVLCACVVDIDSCYNVWLIQRELFNSNTDWWTRHIMGIGS